MTSKRIFWADMARIIGVLLVIVMHSVDRIVFSAIENTPTHMGMISFRWLTGVTYKSIASICVPILLMLSGYLLLSENQNITDFLKKRLSKVVIPLFVWTIMYLLWDGAFAGKTYVDIAELSIQSFLANTGKFHLWFLYALLGLYIVTPILRCFVRTASDTDLLYAIGVWLAASIVFELFSKTVGYRLVLFEQHYVSGFLGYYLAGYYIGRQKCVIKIVWTSVIAILILVIGKSFWAYCIRVNNGVMDAGAFDYLKWHVILLSIAGFIAIKEMACSLEKRTPPAVQNILTIISKTTFGIYLVHVMVLKILNDGLLGFRLCTDSFHPFFAIPLTAGASFFISFIIIYPVQRIPVIRKIVP